MLLLQGMPMALPSGYENVVRHVTSDHHADQNFEPDLATHEATVRYNYCIGKSEYKTMYK